MTVKGKALVVAGLLASAGGGYAFGRYATPAKVVTTEKVVTVEKQVAVIQERVKVERVFVDRGRTTTRKTETVTPASTTRTEEVVEDRNVTENTSTGAAVSAAAASTGSASTATKSVQIAQRADWRVGVLAGAAFSNGAVSPRVGVRADRSVLGPISVSGWLLAPPRRDFYRSDFAAGVGLSIDF